MNGAWRTSQFHLGIEGLALLRRWVTGDPREVSARISEIEGLCERFRAPGPDDVIEVVDSDVTRGYDALAPLYDGVPNGLLIAETPPVRSLLDTWATGRVLDAACGTGRHTQYLAQRGNDVTGVDLSEGMLRAAREKVPGATFVRGDLEALSLATGSFDGAICCLALTHLPNLRAAVGELARVLRPGGRLLLSDIHPFAAATGAHVAVGIGERRFVLVRNYLHPHSRYLDAFAEHGLAVTDCIEPLFDADRYGESGGVTDELREASVWALSGLPFALIWQLRK